MRKFTINLMAVLAIWAIIMFCFGCKTRKVDLQTSHVVKEATEVSNSATKRVDSTKSIDNTTKQEHSLEATKSSQIDSTELEADSIVITKQPNGTKKTTVYLKPGSKVKHQANSNLDRTIDNTVNTAYAKSVTNVSTMDSAVNKKSLTKSDSSGKAKVTSAIGSGSVWAKWGTVIGGVVLIVIALLVYLRFRR
jgi:hypothetical protein